MTPVDQLSALYKSHPQGTIPQQQDPKYATFNKIAKAIDFEALATAQSSPNQPQDPHAYIRHFVHLCLNCENGTVEVFRKCMEQAKTQGIIQSTYLKEKIQDPAIQSQSKTSPTPQQPVAKPTNSTRPAVTPASPKISMVREFLNGCQKIVHSITVPMLLDSAALYVASNQEDPEEFSVPYFASLVWMTGRTHYLWQNDQKKSP